jgi:Xaa-Pro aminopeptidase
MNRHNPPQEDLLIRKERVTTLMREQGIEAGIISSNANLLYLAGAIFNGYLYIDNSGMIIAFYRRPFDSGDMMSFPIRKLEDIPSILKENNIAVPCRLGLESDRMPYNEALRFQAAFGVKTIDNVSGLLRMARMIKTPWEIEQMRQSARTHVAVYKQIPRLYKPGMRDIDLQIAIEKLMREQGSVGLFRTFGSNMEVFMGTVLVGDNAEAPSPFDFALGGAGIHAALPLGASGRLIEPGLTVMVDMAGNYTTYISDITRIYSLGNLPELATRAHQVSIDMHNRFRETVKEGVACADVHNWSVEMVNEAGLADYFMGTTQQAKFVGHGAGIEINEPPVMMSRSKDHFMPGMIIAFEPKFVIPGTGAIGIENTYLITEAGMENLTEMEEGVIGL